MADHNRKLVFLGVGQVARALAQVSHEFAPILTQTTTSTSEPESKNLFRYSMYGTTRSAERVAEIRALGIEPVVVESFENLGDLLDGAYVVVSFPPDSEADVVACRAAQKADGIVYISSTAVYGKKEGIVTEESEVDSESPQGKARLDAEQKWLKVGASILRAPGIYGRGSGLHQRLISGNYRLPGDGTNFVSRIHVDDLAQMIMKALVLNKRSQIFLCGDTLPTTHREIVEWLAERLNLPIPDSVPLEQCHYTQRGNRRVDAANSLQQLSVELRYPTYKDGYSHELRGT